jgi:hypothetical protein
LFVGFAGRDDPLLGLARQLRHVFEVFVVVQNREVPRFRGSAVPRFRDCSNERIDKREHSVLASGAEKLLYFERPLIIPSVYLSRQGSGPRTSR